MDITDEEFRARAEAHIALARSKEEDNITFALMPEIVSADAARTQIDYRITCASWHCNPMGNMHGGAIATILDNAVGIAVIAACGTIMTPTIDFSINYLGAIPMGTDVNISARADRIGGRIAYCSGEMTDAATGALLARAVGTYYVIRPKGR